MSEKSAFTITRRGKIVSIVVIVIVILAIILSVTLTQLHHNQYTVSDANAQSNLLGANSNTTQPNSNNTISNPNLNNTDGSDTYDNNDDSSNQLSDPDHSDAVNTTTTTSTTVLPSSSSSVSSSSLTSSTTTTTTTTTTSSDESSSSTTTTTTSTSITTSSSDSTPGSGFHGDGTYYTVTGTGSCGWKNNNSQLVGALNRPQMGQDSYSNPNCGKCALITGPKGQVKVEIVDTCPECLTGDIDLSPTAFGTIAEMVVGRVDITWDFVDC